MMMMRTVRLVAAASALGMSLAAPASAQVQSITTNSNANVFVSILGGFAPAGAKLYLFLDPFDPVTGLFSPHNGIEVGPSAQARARNKAWLAGANSTALGRFAAGTELFFGLWLPGSQWLLSSNFASSAAMSSATKPNRNILSQAPISALGNGASSEALYGWAVNPTTGDDYNDFVFKVTEATVTPEPATMTLLGLGLAGVGGMGALRRRRNRPSA